MSKRKGTNWIWLGMVLLTAAIVLFAYNIIVTNRAGRGALAAAQELEKVISSAPASASSEGAETEYPDYVLNPNMDMPEKEMDGASYIGLLEIPSLELKLPVQSAWSYDEMKTSPCRYSGSAYQNNMVICGHNYVTHFGPLGDIENSVSVYFTDMDGNQFSYKVAETEILAGDDVEKMVSGDWDLTLFTCTLSGISRLTIRCVLTDTFPKR